MNKVEKIKWDESLLSGDPRIDVQHKFLVEIINELADAILLEKGRKALGKILNMLKYYAAWHFEREEKCMDEVKCPAAMINKEAHVRFVKVFEGYQKQFLANTDVEELSKAMYRTLVDWLVNHIKKVDGQIRTCLHQR
ncbi:MAG: hemerythrin family protein [Calditrichae bacterium]|nr:hemerythrin family protein [Calditrichia bacterium]